MVDRGIFTHILVGTDGSARAEGAVRQGARLASITAPPSRFCSSSTADRVLAIAVEISADDKRPGSAFATAVLSVRMVATDLMAFAGVEPDAAVAAVQDGIQSRPGSTRRAARELYQELARAIDDESMRASMGTRQRVEARWVATMMGRVRLRRYRVKTDDRTSILSTNAWSSIGYEASRALRASTRELASLGLTTHQIAAVLTLVTGSALPRQTVWRMLRSA